MKKVIVVCGGPSSEYEVSLSSSQSIIDNIDYSKYEVSICIIGKDRRSNIERIKQKTDITKLQKEKYSLEETLEKLKSYDTVLLGTHGQFGEDGVLQTYLEENGIVFTGSDSYASRLAMDKYRSSILVHATTGILIPKTQLVRLINLKETLSKISLPVFVKPNKNGSSVCSFVVKNLENIDTLLEEFYKHHKDEDEILIQELIDQKVEVSCGCLEKKDHTILQLPPIEIIPQSSEFFDYKAKYTKGGSLERIPAIGITEEQRKEISNISAQIHNILGCRLYSRSDFLIQGERIYYLETNTLPGMTSTSLIPQEAQAIGLSYNDLITFYIENA